MRYWLHVHGMPPAPDEARLMRADLGVIDEVLCGACGALLTVDHQVWANAGGPDRPGDTAGLVCCELCGSVNDSAWVVRTEDSPEPDQPAVHLRL